MSIRHPAYLQIWLLNSLHRRSLKRLQQGFTLVEALIVVAVVGILAAISAPLWMERPLRQGAQQSGSLFRQVRMRAMSNTTAFRVRPDLTSVMPGTQRATRFLVQASSGKTCGATTNISSITNPTVVGNSSLLPVNATVGFSISDKVTVGESTTPYEVTAVVDGISLTVGGTGPGNQGAALRDAEVELASVWRSGGQFTGLISDDLALAASNSENATIPTQVTIGNQSVPWSLCYNAQGLATLYNARTGRVVNSDLALPVTSCRAGSNCTGTGLTGTATITITRGGSVTVPTNIQ